ncbi:hypothetical protein PENARI_c022G10253 [Penicillium arizonense]|uniref:Transcription factor domain-containing protein n=1 Tax=Penicillium arizonense TaxID=1835702 RepID=A0A1F5L8E2_PENAI|nr:hypothetical protein PENARI_c022G10253 [Penicillium arizonense]OGE49250.1 hypothetical protein PENARI_c022G10253 [Penicillium arizonense]
MRLRASASSFTLISYSSLSTSWTIHLCENNQWHRPLLRQPTYTAHLRNQRVNSTDNIQQLPSQHRRPIITNATRARIIAALATIKGKRGSPFTFVTSGDSPSFSASGNSNDRTPVNRLQQHTFKQDQKAHPSLKLSGLLRPLKLSVPTEGSEDDWRPAGSVKMPSYISSMTLGQTIVDPIKGGIISPQASQALFEFFMVQMNAKWEYLLDPHVDTHDSVQMRNSFLFASILFCSSKFANFIEGKVVFTPDLFLQSRLCSLARSLAIKAIAEGSRSIETMQAFYLLVCWKDADDDISYLHSGYAFRILHDLDLEQGDSDGRQVARQKRTWLALFRQDRQQSLFFVRRASLSQGDEDTPSLGDLNVWLRMPYALPSDFAACCSADLRCIQSKLRHLVQRRSVDMLPCLLELMDADLRSWRFKWHNHLEGEGRQRPEDDPNLKPEFLFPGSHHLTTLMNVWESGVRLNVASSIFRQALMASVSPSVDLNNQSARSTVDIDLSTTQEVLSQNLPGLTSSVEGAFGTLRHLMNFPPSDLRLAPDAVLLLAPNAALFLCLLLCLPGNGVIGEAFQKTTVDLIRDIAQHIGQCIQSPQDTVALHFAYLESLVELFDSTDQQELRMQPAFDMTNLPVGAVEQNYNDAPSQSSHGLTGGISTHSYNVAQNDAILGIADDYSQNLHMQSLANLLDGYLFWEVPSITGDMNLGS